MPVNKSAMQTIFHVTDGERELHSVDAKHALRFPKEWRAEPTFTRDEKVAYLNAQIEAAAAKAEETGLEADKAAAAKVKRENERKIKEVEGGKEPEKPVVAIPEGWQDMKPSERIGLAAKLGADRKGLTAAKADELIEAEVEKRSAE